MARLEQVSANGFAGGIVVEEMEWRTPKNLSPWQPCVYTPIVAAKFHGRGIVMHRGMGTWAGIGGETYDRIRPIARVVRNLGKVLDGAGPATLDVQIETETEVVMSYGFVLPDGDRLFALWTNGAAVDDDPGVPTTFTFEGLPATGAIGMTSSRASSRS